jgi:FkbM family methyltransferase
MFYSNNRNNNDCFSYVGNSRILFFHESGLNFYLDSKDLRATPAILRNVYEPVWSKMFLNEVRNISHEDNPFILEIGAGIGFLTFQAMQKLKFITKKQREILGTENKSKWKIIAVEPNITSFNLLRTNFETNNDIIERDQDHIKLLNCAVSDFIGEVEFWNDIDFPSGSHINNEQNNNIHHGFHPETNSGTIKKIMTRTIDSIILEEKQNKNNQKINLIKIDVEGAEYQVWKGMTNTLDKKENKKDLHILIDIHRFLANKDIDNLVKEIKHKEKFNITTYDNTDSTLRPSTINDLFILHAWR